MAKEKNKGKKKVGVTTKKAVKKSAKKKIAKPAKKLPASGEKPSKKPAAKKKTKRKSETLMCFLTTACVEYYSLPDNGYELNILRNYRDTYLATNADGKKLIRDYYRISPEIVKLVNKDKEKKSVYTYIYSVVKTACAEIENKDLPAAKKTYTGMVRTLMKRYNLSYTKTAQFLEEYTI